MVLIYFIRHYCSDTFNTNLALCVCIGLKMISTTSRNIQCLSCKHNYLNRICSIYTGELLLNTIIFISKWSIWKARNKVKYDKIHINQNVLCNIWKQTLKSGLKILLTANCNDRIDEAKILTILSVISK